MIQFSARAFVVFVALWAAHASAGPGLRMEKSGDATEIFLGNDFLEIGLNAYGSFGTYATPSSAFYGTYSGQGTQGARRTVIGAVYDRDGFNVGDQHRSDYFGANAAHLWEDFWSLDDAQYPAYDANCLGGPCDGVATPQSNMANNYGTVAQISTSILTADSLQVDQTIVMYPSNRIIYLQTAITNRGSVTRPNLKYARILSPFYGACTDALDSMTYTCDNSSIEIGSDGTGSVYVSQTAGGSSYPVRLQLFDLGQAGVPTIFGTSGSDKYMSAVNAANVPLMTHQRVTGNRSPFGMVWSVGDLDPTKAVYLNYEMVFDYVAANDVCGDGSVTGMEGCDDGNKADLDGCSSTCTIEIGYTCPTPGSPCVAATCTPLDVAGLNYLQIGGSCTGSNVKWTDGPSCSVVCKDGYKGSGSASLIGFTCRPNSGGASYVSIDTLTCTAATCDPPSIAMPYAVYACSFGVFTGPGSPSTCTVTCQDGYADAAKSSTVDLTCAPDRGSPTASFQTLSGVLNCVAQSCNAFTLGSGAAHQHFLGASPMVCNTGSFNGMSPSTCQTTCDDGYYATSPATTGVYTCSAGPGNTASYKSTTALACTASTCTAPILNADAHIVYSGHCYTGQQTPASTCTVVCAEGFKDASTSSVTLTCSKDAGESTASYKASGSIDCKGFCARPVFTSRPIDANPQIKQYATPVVDEDNCPEEGVAGEDTCKVYMECPYRFVSRSATVTLNCVSDEDGNLSYAWANQADDRECQFEGLPRNGRYQKRGTA